MAVGLPPLRQAIDIPPFDPPSVLRPAPEQQLRQFPAQVAALAVIADQRFSHAVAGP